MAQEVNKKLNLKLEGPYIYRQLARLDNQQVNLFLAWKKMYDEAFTKWDYIAKSRNIRNEDHHQEEIDFQFYFHVEPHDKRDFEKPILVECVMAGTGKKFANISELTELYDDTIKYFLDDWNSKRKELGFPIINDGNDLLTEIYISFKIDPNSRTSPISIKTVCRGIFEVMEVFVTDFYTFLNKFN